MNRTAPPRLLAAVFVMFAIVVALVELSRDEEEVRAVVPPQDGPADPLRSELRRCQALGEAAVEDAACLAVWDENRRRFLGGDSKPNGDE